MAKSKDYLVHLKSFCIRARSEAEAQRKAEERLMKGFTLPELQIESVEEDECQF